MSRKKVVRKKRYSVDAVYGSEVVSAFINRIMKHGKKSLAEKIFYSALALVEEKTKEKGIEVFYKAIENVSPAIEVRSRRVGGSNYQVPIKVMDKRRQSLALRWMTIYMRQRSERSTASKLAAEIIDASTSTGATFKKKEEVFRTAEANKAFAHYRW